MGMDQAVTFAGKPVPPWPEVRDLLQQRGFSLQMRMIDGQLAFPDEEPGESWNELRLGTPEGMVTVRRTGDQIVFVIWGNADATLRQAWNALAWAYAEVGGGQILTASGPLDASAFRQSAELPAVLR